MALPEWYDATTTDSGDTYSDWAVHTGRVYVTLAGNATKLRVWTTDASGTVRIGLYAWNGSTAPTGVLLASAVGSQVAEGWAEVDITPVAVTAGTYYAVCAQNSTRKLRYDSSNNWRISGNDYADGLPDPWSDLGWGEYALWAGIYVEAAGGGTTAPPTTLAPTTLPTTVPPTTLPPTTLSPTTLAPVIGGPLIGGKLINDSLLFKGRIIQ